MPLIEHTLLIAAPIERVFDLSRSIDLHKVSTSQTGEKAIAGRISGLIEWGETVTWRAKHFGVWQNLSTKITGFESPKYFCDEMISGAFASFKHEHFFSETQNGTQVVDRFDYKSPMGFLGICADHIFLKKYMSQFLWKRNKVIQAFAESDKWKEILATETIDE